MAGINLTNITTAGIDNAVPETRTLTIGGVTYDLSQNRTWAGGGGVTSVAMSVPTGLVVTGSPITTSGTLALTFDTGYSIPLNTKQSNWDDAYTWVAAFPTQTGNAGKYLTTNGSVLSWATISGGVTDGDKGDISVSGSGATWTIDSAVVTYAKMQNVAANSFLANVTGSAASVQEIATNRIPLFSSAITGTPSATTFLRGDGSWQTPAGGGGSPGGTSGEVQFNDGGVFAGAANVEIDNGDLALVDGGFPVTPAAGRTKIFTDSMATRRLVGSIDSSGFHFDFQPALFNSTTYMWLAGTGTTLAINWGSSFTARNNGSGAAQATPAKASTSAITSMNRATFGTGTTTTGASGIQSTETNVWLGNAANLGGFFFFARFGLEAISGTYRFFVGVSANNATMAADSSTWNNTIGFGKDVADSTLQFIIRNNGSVTTKSNTSITPTAGAIYDFYMYVRPNTSQVDFELRDAVTNASLISRTETANLPLNTTFMYMQSHIQSVTGGTAKLLALNRMYLETNL
jgi:hypothetical protein